MDYIHLVFLLNSKNQLITILITIRLDNNKSSVDKKLVDSIVIDNTKPLGNSNQLNRAGGRKWNWSIRAPLDKVHPSNPNLGYSEPYIVAVVIWNRS